MLTHLNAKNALLTFAVVVFTHAQPAQAAAIIDQAVLTESNLAVSGPGVVIGGKVHTNGNFDISGGSTISGLTSAVGYVKNDGVNAPGAGANPGFLNGGFQAGAPSFAYPSMSAVLAGLGVAPNYEIFGNLIYSGSEAFTGIFLVHGFIDISSDNPGTATFLADGNIDVSGSANITGAVMNANFPFGLALFSAGGHVNVSDAIVAGSIAAKTTADVSGASAVTQAPEPSSALLLGLGCLGAAMTRKRKNA